jgi:hypothetical protein
MSKSASVTSSFSVLQFKVATLVRLDLLLERVITRGKNHYILPKIAVFAHFGSRKL